MGKIVVVYGSTTGTCQSIAKIIATKLGADSLSVDKVTAETIAAYDSLVLGSSTWGYGELQDDWFEGIDTFKSADLSSKTIALFGCGDAESYSDTFCDAIGLIYKDLEASGAKFVGSVATDDYSYSGSAAEIDGTFVGLALDDMNESDKTDSRIDNWISLIKDSL